MSRKLSKVVSDMHDRVTNAGANAGEERPGRDHKVLREVVSLLQELLELEKEKQVRDAERRKVEEELTRRKAYGRVATLKSYYSIFAIFLATVSALLLTIPRTPPTNARKRADHAISACWLSSLILALIAVLGTFPIRRRQTETPIVAMWLASIASICTLMVGVGIWVWNEYPLPVAIAVTAIGVSSYLIITTISLVWGDSMTSVMLQGSYSWTQDPGQVTTQDTSFSDLASLL